MPRKTDDLVNSNLTQSTQQNDTSVPMDIEPDNANEHSSPNHTIDVVPDLTNIEEEEIEDKSGNKYIPDRFWKIFIPKDDSAKTLSLVALKLLLANRKYTERRLKHSGPPEVYVINLDWYQKFKKYTKYDTIKRIIKSYDSYEARKFNFAPNEKNFPGEINNKDLLIRNKISESNDNRNILVSKNNTCIDTKLKYKKDYKLLSKERFDLLKNYFKCDTIIKANKVISKEKVNYNVFSAHFKIVFLPRIDIFKSADEEKIEDFRKKYNIIYDIYFHQSDTKEDILNELTNILKEKPEILTNMGVELILQNDEDEISNHVKNFVFYKPNNQNDRTAEDINDSIFSTNSIEFLKKDEKIPVKEVELEKIEYKFDISNLFNLNWLYNKENIDEIPKGILFLEYIPRDGAEPQQKSSIFDIKDIVVSVQTSYEEQSAYRGTNGGPRLNQNQQEQENLDNLPLDKENNKHGLVGLNNLGNTCYMNTGLQCLSNCELLTKYFLGDYYKEFINKDNPIGSQGEIVEKYSQLIHHLWYGNYDSISPMYFKLAFGKMYNAFNDFRQQDCQEFLSYLLDSLHEDLNKVKTKPYIKTKDLPSDISEEERFKIQKELYLCRNQSLIADLIYGFYKSTVYCPDEKCQNIVKTFEPFNMIALSLVNEAQLRKFEEYQNEQNQKMGIKTINVTFIPFKIHFKPLKFPVKVKKEMDLFTFKQKIEKITGFHKNSFDIYKMQGNEFIGVKPNMYMLDDFLKGEKQLYLFQIPPYVFDKPLDYFDKAYEKLNSDHDKLYLEEEKYEGNDIYEIYNKEQNKVDDNMEENPNIINTDNPNEENRENENEEAKNKNKNKNKTNEEEDVEMKDEHLNLDINKWIKAEFYNYSYEKKKNGKNEENRINKSRMIYINREWDNTQVYISLLEMMEGSRDNLAEIKTEWFKDLQDVTKKMGEMENKKKKPVNLLDHFDQNIPNHPLMLQYLGVFNFNKSNIMTKKDGWRNVVFPFEYGHYLLQKIVNKAQIKNDIADIELMFKIIWKPMYAKDYNDATTPIEIVKSERLEEIFKNLKEDELLRKSNMDNLKEKGGKKNKKKLQLNELFNHFSEKEKLTKDNQWFCPKCKQFQLADKKMEIYSVNEIIIIHLKRFRNNRKIENLVEFPIEGLDLSEYLPPNKDEKYIFDLFAVVNHVGGLHSGHYFAYCKNCKENEWYEFNDSTVRKIEKKKIVNDNAYMLFYCKRREENINIEELFKKPFVEIDYSKYV